MRAARIHRFGPPAEIHLEEIDRPTPAPGEVLVRVGAAGVGPWDALIRRGASELPQPLPLTLGSEISGAVVELGSGVRGFSVGEQVFGVTNSRFTGGYAEYAAVPATMIAPRPHTLDPVQAASVPVVAVTAWQMLFDQAQLEAGRTVLVLGAAGNVGAYAVQLARRARARVIPVAKAGELESVRGTVDVVVDTVGGETQRRSFELLAPRGVLVSAVSQPRDRERGRYFIVRVTTPYLERIAGLLDSGELLPHVGAELPLSEVVEAHEMLDGSRPRPRGKIVLFVA